MRGVVGVGAVHGRRCSMARAIVGVLIVIFRRAALALVVGRRCRGVAEGRQILLL